MITQRTRKARRRAAALGMMTCALFLLATIDLVVAADWPMSNHDPGNSRSQPAETTISPANVSRLAPVYTLTTDGDNWATPVVVEGAVYVPDAGGKLWKFDLVCFARPQSGLGWWANHTFGVEFQQRIGWEP